jgi:hypothetical protein
MLIWDLEGLKSSIKPTIRRDSSWAFLDIYIINTSLPLYRIELRATYTILIPYYIIRRFRRRMYPWLSESISL